MRADGPALPWWSVIGGRRRLRPALILIRLDVIRRLPGAEPVKGEATLTVAGGYARLVLKLAEDVESEVTTAGYHPRDHSSSARSDIPIDRVFEAAPDYVTSARRDPDGSAIRLSLARRVTINTMTAGERVFVDMLPDNWKRPASRPSFRGGPRTLRARAGRGTRVAPAARSQRGEEASPVRIRASVQPTFVRFVFETPDGVGVSSVLNDQKLTLFFNAALTFDLADAKLAAPSNIASINQKVEGEASAVEVVLIGDVDVHSFREDKNYIIDVALSADGKAGSAAVVRGRGLACSGDSRSGADRPSAPRAGCSRAERPARREFAVTELRRRSRRRRRKRSREQAKIEIKPEAAPKLSPAPEPPVPARPARRETAPRPRRRPPPKIAVAASEPPPEAKPARAPPGCRHARQRRPAPEVFLCHRDAGGIVPPRRHGVAGVRFLKAVRHRADPQQGRGYHRRGQPVAAGQWSGDPHPPQPPANAFADGEMQATALRTGR